MAFTRERIIRQITGEEPEIASGGCGAGKAEMNFVEACAEKPGSDSDSFTGSGRRPSHSLVLIQSQEQ